MTAEPQQQRRGWLREHLPLAIAAGLVLALAASGVLLWWPDRATQPISALGLQLVGGSVVALAILSLQLAWDARLRAEDARREREAEQAEEERRSRDDRWESLTVQTMASQHRELTRLLLNLVLNGEGTIPLDLRGLDLSGLHLEGRVLARAKLTGCVLRGATLTRATLTGADLSGAQLQDADLTNATLDGADLRNARLDRATLTGASMHGARLEGAILTGAVVDGVDQFAAVTVDADTVLPAGVGRGEAGSSGPR